MAETKPAIRERTRLSISKADLDDVCSQNSLSGAQSDRIWQSLQQRFAEKPQFDLAHVSWYTGALVALVAMGLALGEVASRFGDFATLVTSLLYTALFFGGAAFLTFKRALRVPGGLLATLAVALTPLTVGALEQVMHIEVFSNNSMFAMELATIFAGLAALRWFKFPFLTAPISAALWFMAFTATELFFGSANSLWNAHLYVSMAFGLGMVSVSFLIDRRSDEDYSFWGYLFGVAAFWIALSLFDTGGELGKFIYLLINIGLMFVSVLLSRRVFVVAGTLGLLGYLFHLSWSIFAGSLLFPFVLGAIGLGIIYLGIKYHNNQARIDRMILSVVPEAMRRQLPDFRN